MKAIQAFAKQVNGTCPNLDCMLPPPKLFPCTRDTLKRVQQVSQKLSADFYVHIIDKGAGVLGGFCKHWVWQHVAEFLTKGGYQAVQGSAKDFMLPDVVAFLARSSPLCMWCTDQTISFMHYRRLLLSQADACSICCWISAGWTKLSRSLQSSLVTVCSPCPPAQWNHAARSVTRSRRMENGSSTVRYLRKRENARAATWSWDRLTIGEGDAAIGRQSQPLPAQRLLALPIMYNLQSFARLLRAQPSSSTS